MASRGPERSGHRYPGAAAPGPLGSFAFLSQVTPYGRESTARHHHGQATELCCSEDADFAGCGTPPEPLSEQSSRELASANPHARKADEALSIARARSTFSLCLRVGQRSISLASTSPLRSQPSAAAQASVSPLEQDRPRSSPSITRNVSRALLSSTDAAGTTVKLTMPAALLG